MRQKWLRYGLLFIGAGLLILPLTFADTDEANLVYVTKTKVQLREGPDDSAYKAVGEVKYRDLLEVLETKDDWYRVKAFRADIEGWIYQGKVSAQQPQIQKSKGDELGKELRGGSGSETAQTAAAAGIRDFDAKNYQGLKGDFKSVELMEQLRKQITDKDVLKFARSGKLK